MGMEWRDGIDCFTSPESEVDGQGGLDMSLLIEVGFATSWMRCWMKWWWTIPDAC